MLNAFEAAEESHAARLKSIIETPAAVIEMDNQQSHGQRRTSRNEMDNSQEAHTLTVILVGCRRKLHHLVFGIIGSRRPILFNDSRKEFTVVSVASSIGYCSCLEIFQHEFAGHHNFLHHLFWIPSPFIN